MDFHFNHLQTQITQEILDKYPKEVQEQFIEDINNIPFVKSLISKDRPYARDIARDNDGKIIIDITKPHILEDMNFFRPSALHYEKYGCYTNLAPNSNPNSEFGKWLREEARRCYKGYIRESDGEWITGEYYFFLNYCPIQVAKVKKGSKRSDRIIQFPHVWEGHYYLFHYWEMARNDGHHACMLARRGCGKSFTAASRLARNFVLGDIDDDGKPIKKVQSVVTAAERKYIQGANQLLDMFVYYIDFLANNTQFPSKRLINSLHDMQWTMGYIDAENGTKKGTLNSVTGITSKDDESKLIGSRGQLYIIEEMGSFPRLLGMYARLRPSVEDGENVFGQIEMHGTSGDDESNFSSAQEIMYNPKGYNVQALPNIYDIDGKGRKDFTYFFPSYLNRANCYDENGNSDVTKALLEILKDRYIVKYNSTDIRMITKRIAELPITPAEAVLRASNNIFPVSELQERLMEIDNNPSFYNDTYIGELVAKPDGKIEFRPTLDNPVRDFKVNDNDIVEGALEIFEMPITDMTGKIPPERYIIGHDPVDNDEDKQGSLSSTFVLDLWTDRIVAEYTGRHKYSDDNYEILRKLCLFYNAKCLYENNIKGVFSYFSQKNCLYLLADTPEYLVDKQLIKGLGYGNTSKGVRATAPINNYANKLIQQWMLKPTIRTTINADGQEVETQVSNLFNIKNRALLKECILYTPLQGNYDRIRALGLVMLYREEKVVLYQGILDKGRSYIPDNYIGNDPFFKNNYNNPYDEETESF